MTAAKVGLLPLYVELYDRIAPAVRPRVEGFYATITADLRKRGIEVVTVPVCRLAHEFSAAVAEFESAGVDAIVTLHLAYSPSLESAGALAATALPVIVLDTTPAYEFGPDQDPAEVMHNHGIHGVQDMCNLLVRNGKRFEIETGHYERSDVLDGVAAAARAARAARRIRGARIGRIGGSFTGMGDFSVPDDVLRDTLGLEIVRWEPAAAVSLVPEKTSPAVAAEIASEVETFEAAGVDAELLGFSAQTSLAIRDWMDCENLDGFTMNFMDITRESGLPAVPFVAASKAMARGKGYAGEGDVLTAALIAGIASSYPDTTFSEMFCPDWAGDRIFLSHMGEFNVALTSGRPTLMERPFPFTDIGRAVVALGRLRAGDAVLVNAAPGPGGSYSLVVAAVEMLEPASEDRFVEKVRGWFRPEVPIREFLADYSRAGGTHHCALVYGARTEDIARIGDLLGWSVVEIGAEPPCVQRRSRCRWNV